MKLITIKKKHVLALLAFGVLGTLTRSDDLYSAEAEVEWLEGVPEEGISGGTWGVPWPIGTLSSASALGVLDEKGNSVSSQTWPLAYWPDGSLKWTAHAIAASDNVAQSYKVVSGKAHAPEKVVLVREDSETVSVETELAKFTFNRTGESLIRSIERSGKVVAHNGRLIALSRDSAEMRGTWAETSYASKIEAVVVEQSGPIRAVIKVEGSHANDAREWLPFVVRFYVYAGSDTMRIMHSFIYDGDEYADFVSGMGLRFEVPMGDPLYDRHVRFVGEGDGLFAEAIKGITGLRRDPGDAAREAQIAGRSTPPLETWDQRVVNGLPYVPAWGDYSLSQLSSEGFRIQKRTQEGHAWIDSATGHRSGGVGYVGGALQGGVSFGMRDFWQSHPSQMDVRNAESDTAEVTLWIWSPVAQPMDFRFFHDGMGMDTYPKQIDGLNITYEDYEDGYATPYGIARTSEFYLKAEDVTPSRESLVSFADQVRLPAQLTVGPEHILASGVFGAQWSLPKRDTKITQWLEDRLEFKLDAYVAEVDKRDWYGFWHYGDVMHTYDTDRHVWRYDVGGFGWDNAELSPPIWLWLSYFRTGRADVFRFAEAMCRHNCDVDTYHLGRFRGLGTRHGVQHWGDSSKQTRISTASYFRHYYYLTADERTGDLLRDSLFGIEAEKKINVGRKVGGKTELQPLPPIEAPEPGGEVVISGLGIGNFMASWITEAERTNDPVWHDRILKVMKGLSEHPYGFFGTSVLNIDTGEISPLEGGKPVQSHLRSCFGLPEISLELIRTYGEKVPEYADRWAEYGRLYNGTAEEQKEVLGISFRNANLRDSHSRHTAYAALHLKDPSLAKRAWKELLKRYDEESQAVPDALSLKGPEVLNPIDEYVLGTNGSQWEIAALECLAFLREWTPENWDDVK
ncbi:Tat pathway signal sequence domain protein [Pelagicoccus albus]|uniref:Tat pathway signal sequence domain protein n=1 Tax=Pelagicoccus albus TaxID=415222 RepID=A0A7X1E8F9_9BACT|nr:Tat pathway signal sequence domain protein [Pelagicoccus albus]MBC2606108.1 Tat pathway signal sequence domain protein [Pelagicoccus albus]